MSPQSDEGDIVEDLEEEDGTLTEHSRPSDGTFQFNGCQYVSVYIKSGNASGNKVEDSGHIVPQVIHHGGTVIVPSNINEGATRTSSPKPKVSSPQASDLIDRGAIGSPSSMISPPLPCHMKEDSSPYSSVAQSNPPSAPSVGLPSGSRQNNPFLKQLMIVPPADIPLQTVKEGQTPTSPRKKDKLPAITETTPKPAIRGQHAPKLPAITLSAPAFKPIPMNPFPSPTHMGLPPNFLSHILQPFPDNLNVQNIPPNNNNTTDDWTTNSSRDILDSDSKRLEHHLHSALTIVVKASGISRSVEILTPQAHSTLKAINALVFVETPVPSPKTSDPSAPPNSVGREMIKWLRTSRSPE